MEEFANAGRINHWSPKSWRRCPRGRSVRKDVAVVVFLALVALGVGPLVELDLLPSGARDGRVLSCLDPRAVHRRVERLVRSGGADQGQPEFLDASALAGSGDAGLRGVHLDGALLGGGGLGGSERAQCQQRGQG